jgi:hypothetical protein
MFKVSWALYFYRNIKAMGRQHHYLKTEPKSFKEVYFLRKKFELRKNDRDFKVGDMITLLEYRDGSLTGKFIADLRIKYILKGGKYGLDKDYCIINW